VTEDACLYVGEMAFPFPFSILMGIIILGMGIAWLLNSKTHFFSTLLAFNDTILKLNWIFLLPYLLETGNSKVSAFIIAYCLFANLVVNMIIWRISFKNNSFDQSYQSYVGRYPKLHKFLKLSSYTVSLQLFRLTHSKLLGKKCFSADFGERQGDLKRVLGSSTIVSVVFCALPALAANIYNLFYALNGS